MAVSGKTDAFEIPFLEESDIPDMGAGDKAIAERMDELFESHQWASRNIAPTAGIVSANFSPKEALGLTTSYQDMTGATLELTPEVSGALKVTAIFVLLASGEPGEAVGTISVDGVDQASVASLLHSGAGETIASVSQVYLVPLSAGNAHTIKMRAKAIYSGGFSTCRIGTRFLYELIAV